MDVVYTSNAGSTRAYAQLLGKETGFAVYSLDEAEKKLSPGTRIIYFGWLMAGSVKGYKKAARRYKIAAVCAVGMGGCGTQLSEVRKQNGISDAALFTLQGAFQIEKLKGVYRFMMGIMQKSAGKALEKKADRTPEEEDMLVMMKGANRVSVQNLMPVIDWIKENG